jgi:hypothetical protein
MLWEKLYAAWWWVRERAAALKPCRVPLLLVLAGLAFLLLASQGEDVARALAERRSGHVGAAPAFWFFAATLAWSLSAWYWARVMLFLKLPGVPEQVPDLQALRTWMPRLLGFFAALGVALAFYRAARGYAAGEHEDVQELLHFYGFWCTLGAFAFFIAVSVRRRAARFAYGKLAEGSRLQSALAPALNLPPSADQSYGGLTFRELAPLTRGLLFAALAAFGVLFVVLTAAPHWAAPAIGSAAIVLLAAAGWIALASTLDFIGMRLRVPVFSALLVLAVVCSLWNDNHAVRTLDAAQPKERPDLRAQLDDWMARHAARLKDPKARVPLYVVNAEGGGIRAAYWTVTVLGEIQKRQPAFAEHLFSLSGVSGGSLGSAVFVALLAQSREDRMLDIKQTAQAILSEDFLSPVVASMLYPDLVQRFLPVPVARFDRAATLEQSWERAWRMHVPTRARMSEPLDRLWEDPKHWTPALLLNATWVETGKRLIASNLRIAPTKASEDFVDVEDANAFFAPRSLSLASAAHMSARFTYVSPAGTLVKDGRIHGRVVDGGYFENSGATATYEILQTLDLLKEKDPRWERVDAYVIHISNDPVEAKYGLDSLASAPDNPRIAPKHFLNEALSPLWALLNTRDARGYHARESVMWKAGWSYSFHFGLCRNSSNVPLGWVLSRSTRDRMETQLAQAKCGELFDNPANLKAIDRHFAPPERPAVKTNGGGPRTGGTA